MKPDFKKVLLIYVIFYSKISLFYVNIIFLICSSDTEYNPSRDEQDEHEMEQATGFAVVINGHSLVHALHPQLEQLFLEVSSRCKFYL